MKTQSESIIKPGSKVLVRCDRAGVHYGELVDRDGQETHLKNARRIWSWSGALSLSEIAVNGVDIKNSKISIPVDEVILPTTIEVLSVKDGARLP